MLQHIQTTSCPTCGAPSVLEKIKTGINGEILVHVNGERWEERTFSCGLTIEYIPNFRAASVLPGSYCHREPGRVKVLKKRTEFREALARLIESQFEDTDKEYRFKVAKVIRNNFDLNPEYTPITEEKKNA